MTDKQQIEFNQLHITFITKDKRFRYWGELTENERFEITDNAEGLAKDERNNSL